MALPPLPAKGGKSTNHKIEFNREPAAPGSKPHPYKLLWSVKRQGSSMGFPVQMNRPSDREGAEEFAERWGVKMPAGATK